MFWWWTKWANDRLCKEINFNDISKTARTFCVTQLKHKSPWLSHTQYTWSSLFCNRWVLNWISSRPDDGLSTISRCGLNATFKVPVFSFVSTFLRLIAPENYAQLLILQEFWQFFINMPQVKREWFCAPYFGWHLCRLRLHLWNPLHSCPECHLKAFSLIDFAITLPDGSW